MAEPSDAERALLEALQAFLSAETWAESRRVVEEHPELLSAQAEALLAQLAAAQEDEDARRFVEEHRTLLARCRAVGVEAAFAEMTRGPQMPPELAARLRELGVETEADLERVLQEHPELREQVLAVMAAALPPLEGAILRLINAQSPAEVVKLAGAYPILLGDEAVEAIEEAIAKARAAGEDSIAQHIEERLAVLRALRETGVTPEAIAALRAEAEAPPTPDFGPIPDDLEPILRELGQPARPSDMPQRVRLCQRALELVRREDNPTLWATLQVELANSLAQNPLGNRAENIEKAIAHYEAALGVRTREAFPADHRRTARLLGNVFLTIGRWEEAHQVYDSAIEATRALYPAAASDVGRLAELAEAGDAYANDAYTLACLGCCTKAVERIEEGRAQELARALARDRAALHELDDTDREAYERTAERVRSLEAELRRADKAGARRFLDIVADRRQAQEKLDEVIADIRIRHPDFMRMEFPFADIAAAAGAECPLVYLATTPAGSVAFIVRAGATEVVWLDFAEKDLDTILAKQDAKGRWRGYLPAQFGYDSISDVLAKVLPILGQRLMAPLVERLLAGGWRQVALVPCGRLGLLPLHAAHYPAPGGERPATREGDHRYVLDDLTISYAPSARALRVCQEALTTEKIRAPSALAVGNPKPVKPPTRPLQYARAEAEAIIRHFPKETSELLVETQATREAVLAHAPGKTHLHFSCHGKFDPGNPLESGLLLADEERLTLGDILEGQTDLGEARLAVLSACQTAITDFNRVPEEAIGLPAGFIQAGVEGVVGSLWLVNDRSTALLMGRFYENYLQRGLAPAQALREAQIWLRDGVTVGDLSRLAGARGDERGPREWLERFLGQRPEERPFADPYYWAAFTMVGA